MGEPLRAGSHGHWPQEWAHCGPRRERWFYGPVADLIRDEVRLSETAVLRLALDRLRGERAAWPELRDAVLAETRERGRRP